MKASKYLLWAAECEDKNPGSFSLLPIEAFKYFFATFEPIGNKRPTQTALRKTRVMRLLLAAAIAESEGQ